MKMHPVICALLSNAEKRRLCKNRFNIIYTDTTLRFGKKYKIIRQYFKPFLYIFKKNNIDMIDLICNNQNINKHVLRIHNNIGIDYYLSYF